MRVEIVHATDRFAAIAQPWEGLCKRAGASIFSTPAFLAAWWRAFAGVDDLRVLCAWLGEELVAVWPLRLRAARTAAFGARTLTPLGDGRTLERSLVCAPGAEALAAGTLLSKLLELRDWDFLDAPQEPDAILEGLTRVADQAGFSVEAQDEGERAVAVLPPYATPQWEALARVRQPLRRVPGAAFAPAELDVAHGVDELHRLLRREWAERDQASPVLDPALLRFLHEVLPVMTPLKQARVSLIALAGVGAIAADVVIVDGARHVQLLRGTDPAHAPAGATDELCWESMALAARQGATSFALADDDSPLATARVRVRRMQMWNGTAVGRLFRGVASLRRRRKALAGARPSPQKSTLGRMFDAFAEARPESARKIVERLGDQKTLHLYRGELFAREVDRPAGLELAILDLAAFEAMPEAAREALVSRLELPSAYTRQKWRRGDLAVVATLEGRPAGIAWCARSAVFVPDIGREIRPMQGECYIHEVFVHPDERGKKIAPAMLDRLARHLRARDVYRAWALIERTNAASVRAFERADYVAVADVVYVQMGLGSHLFVRPPDPEARALLGL
jgi:ribosomal protein S18 acetylase RimI-like enzyme